MWKNALLMLIAGVWILPLSAMKLDRVILSSNNDPNYLQFWPVVAPIWKLMGLQPTLALIANEDCIVDTSIGDVIRFSPIEGVPESTQAQAIRLLLPILFPGEVCITSDIDMIPISRSYFHDGASICPEDTFLVYRDSVYPEHYPMCYVAGKGAVFGAVFSVYHYEDIEPAIKKWNALGHGWNTDERVLYQSVLDWKERGGKMLILHSGAHPRLDRGGWFEDLKEPLNGYIDCHCPRPYEDHQKTIDQVVEAIYALYTD